MNTPGEHHNKIKQSAYTHSDIIRGVGVGYRAEHFEYIEQNKPDIPWLEILIDNYMMDDSPSLYYLDKVAQNYPLTFHAVGMSLGSADELDFAYLEKLKQLIEQYQPVYVSDHLCWTSINGYHSHDLLPIPYTEEAIDVVIKHIKQVQDFLGRRILLENVSSYITYKNSAMQEWEFLKIIAEQADCDILLDINNIYVSAINHKAINHNIDAKAYLEHLPVERVKEMHLAGYTDMATHLLDSHAEKVHQPVWQLYQKALERFGNVPTLIEWDNDIPDFSVLQAEAKKAERIMQQVLKHVA